MFSKAKAIIVIISGITMLYCSILDTPYMKPIYPNIAIDLVSKTYKYKMSWKLNTTGGFREKIKN